jgi:hypothetical protein
MRRNVLTLGFLVGVLLLAPPAFALSYSGSAPDMLWPTLAGLIVIALCAKGQRQANESSMGSSRLRGWVIGFFLCVLLGSGLRAAPAQAIPLTGDYVFTDPNISGSFTSTGSALSAWNFSSDVFDRLFLHDPTPDTLSWSSLTDIPREFPININTETFFTTNNGVDFSSVDAHLQGHYATLQWNQNSSVLNAFLLISATCCDAAYEAPVVSFARASTSVPEPGTLGLMAINLVTLAVCQWRQQRQGRSKERELLRANRATYC